MDFWVLNADSDKTKTPFLSQNAGTVSGENIIFVFTLTLINIYASRNCAATKLNVLLFLEDNESILGCYAKGAACVGTKVLLLLQE